jgi:hypothetical protein
LHLPGEDGSTLFKRLDQVRKETGKVDARLVAQPLPLAGEHIWKWFWELDAGREETMNGLARISHSQIAAWCSITGNIVRDHELQILLAMDRARREASTPKPGLPPGVSDRPMTPELFDAMFCQP